MSARKRPPGARTSAGKGMKPRICAVSRWLVLSCLTGGSGTAAPVSIAVISRLSHVDCEWSESSVVLSRISLRRASGHEPPRSLFQNRVSACLGGQTGVEDPSALDAVAIRHRVHADLTRDEGDLGVLQRQR